MSLSKYPTLSRYNLTLVILISVAVLYGQNDPSSVNEEYKPFILNQNNISSFGWLNEPQDFDIKDGILTVVTNKDTDFFNNPEDLKKTSTAPFLYIDQKGDFVAKARVKPDFTSQWNAISLMVHIDNDHWIKFAFENSDATGPSIVSVVTKEVSDDANGVILAESDEIWLKLVCKDNIYSMFWSIDDKDYKMTRLTTLPNADNVKIGIEMQSPVGESAQHIIKHFEIHPTTVKNLRKGI